ncbi:MAG TPA: FtsX-like permease family protein [Steroidobacteraceae bacterium]|nr:FtsX-like permease family protein [Steroidobacteraceae bacterium]
MLRHYILAALRNLARNKLYSTINVVGLAVGFAAATLIALFVRDELTFDRQWPQGDRIYLVAASLKVPGRELMESQAANPDVAVRLRARVPASVLIARLLPEEHTVRRGEIENNEVVNFADEQFFSVLRMPTVAGNLATALQRPDGLVLTASAARKYFGRIDAIGEMLELDRKHPMRVAAVVPDLPSNVHLRPDIFAAGRASFSPLTAADAAPWPPRGLGFNARTYVKLPPGMAAERIARELPAMSAEYEAAASKTADFAVPMKLVPIADVHMTLPQFGPVPAGNATVLYVVSLIAALIVAVAAINFVTLMTARAARRATEIAIRKTVGARPRDLTIQFIGESILYALLAVVVAFALVELLLPAFNNFVQRAIRLSYVHDFAFVGAIAALAVITGALAGIYPALVLSRFRPAQVFQGGPLPAGGSAAVRQALVIAQFAVLITLIVAATVVYRQVHFAMNEGWRLDKDQVLAIRSSCRDAFAIELRKLPGVRAAACSGGTPYGLFTSGGVLGPDGTQLSMAEVPIEPGFFQLYGMQQPLAGRFFSADRPAEVGPRGGDGRFIGPVILNETAARMLRFATPEAAIGQVIRQPPGRYNTGVASEVVGVVADFPIGSLRTPIDPVVFFTDAGFFDIVSVKLDGRQIPETLAAIDRLWQQLGEPRPVNRWFADEFLEDVYREDLRQGQMAAVAAGIAVFIACLGLFGLAAFTAERRTKEIGVRKALGASRGDIVRMLLWQFTKPVLWASLIAWPVCWYAMHRWLERFAYRTEIDVWTLLGASALAVVIALATVATHAIVVARARPVTALRYE